MGGKTNLQGYLKPRFAGTYRDRSHTNPILFENFEALDAPGSTYDGAQVETAIIDYFTKEMTFNYVSSSAGAILFDGPQKIGINLTFIERGHALESRLDHRFRVSVIDLNPRNITRSDKVADAAIDCLNEQRAK